MTPRLYAALIHHPVLNRKGEVVASAVTNLDLHDIARAGRTYGVRRFYVVTPLEDQRQIARRIIAHWTEGAGGRLNPMRKEALARVRLAEHLAEAAADVESDAGAAPLTVATSAAPQRRTIGFSKLRRRVHDGGPVLLIFGTAWVWPTRRWTTVTHCWRRLPETTDTITCRCGRPPPLFSTGFCPRKTIRGIETQSFRFDIR